MVYVDASRPALVDGFTRKTFTAMVEGVRDQALAIGLIDRKTWNQGIADLYRTTQADGTFCYTFFKGVGNAIDGSMKNLQLTPKLSDCRACRRTKEAGISL